MARYSVGHGYTARTIHTKILITKKKDYHCHARINATFLSNSSCSRYTLGSLKSLLLVIMHHKPSLHRIHLYIIDYTQNICAG